MLRKDKDFINPKAWKVESSITWYNAENIQKQPECDLDFWGSEMFPCVSLFDHFLLKMNKLSERPNKKLDEEC